MADTGNLSEKHSRKKILWLASWYPSELDAFRGDFIQRHAEAVSLYHDVTVLYVVRDGSGSVTRNVREEKRERSGLREHLVYYYRQEEGPGWLNRIFSELRYRKLSKKAIRSYIRKEGKPDLVHVHVCVKGGWAALWMLKRYGIPFVVTEHWSAFLPEATPTFAQLPAYYRQLARKVFRKAAAVSAVSRHLGHSLQPYLRGQPCTVIPNVVNTRIFYGASVPGSGTLRMVHISGLEDLKNPEAILRAAAILKARGGSMQLDVFGPANPSLSRLADQLNLLDVVQFRGMVGQEVLADALRQAHALILYSHYETFGCVLIEANACGTPVVVSDLPVFREIIRDGVNGLFVRGEDPEGLAARLLWLAEHLNAFNREAISAGTAERFSYERVGQQFSRWYSGVPRESASR